MSALVLVGWVTVAALLAWRGRPDGAHSGAARLASTATPTSTDASVASPRSFDRHLRAIEQLGALLQGRVPALALVPTIAVGAALLVGLVVLPLSTTWALVLAVSTAAGAGWHHRRAVRQRQRQLERCLPTVVELLRLGVDAGLSTRLAFATITPHLASGLAPEMAPVLQRMIVDLEHGASLADSMRQAGRRLGTSVDELMTVLASAEHTGAAVGPLLERFADDLRRAQRLVAAEARARRLPVVLLLPLVFCVLPAFVIVAVVPMLVTGTASYSFPSP